MVLDIKPFSSDGIVIMIVAKFAEWISMSPIYICLRLIAIKGWKQKRLGFNFYGMPATA
jgi:hypothetical protein